MEAPFTGETLAIVPRGTPADVAAACAAAREAQAEWAQRSFGERAAVLLRFHDLLIDNAAEILDVIQLEAGKARKHAFEEVLDTAIQARYYAHTAAGVPAAAPPPGGAAGAHQGWEHHHPRGVVGIIAPWNYPLTLAVGDAIPALMAGNGVVHQAGRADAVLGAVGRRSAGGSRPAARPRSASSPAAARSSARRSSRPWTT